MYVTIQTHYIKSHKAQSIHETTQLYTINYFGI